MVGQKTKKKEKAMQAIANLIVTLVVTISNTVLWGALIPCEGHFTFKSKKLNLEECYIGAGVGLAGGLLIWYPLALILAPVCGFLWAWAGADNTSKNWRKLGIGALMAVLGLLFGGWWSLLVFPLMWGATSLGYGTPSPTDEGSAIGKFWYRATDENKKLSDVLTRGTVGLCYGLALVPLIF